MINAFIEYDNACLNSYYERDYEEYKEELDARKEYEDWEGNNQYDIAREERA